MTDTLSSNTETAEALRLLLQRYAQPDKSIVTKVPKGGGGKVDAVGHAEATRILIQEDPLWSWEPQAWSPEGGPLITKSDNNLVMWGWITIHGKRMPCVGTCLASQKEPEKELIGDLIRNGALRFGIALNLWSKAEKAEADYQPAEPEPADFFGWNSQQAHDAWWDVQKARLKALNDASRDAALGHLRDAALFDGRKPKLPFHVIHREEIEAIINGAERASSDAGPASPEHSDAAKAVLIEVFDQDLSKAEPWMWDLAEVEDLDAHDWKATAKVLGWRQSQMLAQAQFVADRMLPDHPNMTIPERLDEIHGPLAHNLRLSLIMQEEPF